MREEKLQVVGVAPLHQGEDGRGWLQAALQDGLSPRGQEGRVNSGGAPRATRVCSQTERPVHDQRRP